MIYILSAPVQTGKTTSLIEWSSGKKDVWGILTPVINGKRGFMDLHSREQFPMEAVEGEETLDVGRFQFSKKHFNKAIEIIREAIKKDGWIIIDEIGPLELRGQGFHDIAKQLLAKRKERIILVVREGLAQQVKDHFMIDATIIDAINKL